MRHNIEHIIASASHFYSLPQSISIRQDFQQNIGNNSINNVPNLICTHTTWCVSHGCTCKNCMLSQLFLSLNHSAAGQGVRDVHLHGGSA